MKVEEGTKRAEGVRFSGATGERVVDRLTSEAPLHLKVNGVSYTTTMRTPGDDEALARGLLFTEGIVTDLDAPMRFDAIADPETGGCACLEIQIDEALLNVSVEGRRSMLSASSCGVCGTRDPADIEVYGPPLPVSTGEKLDVTRIPALLKAMEDAQAGFASTGGSHAAAAFTSDGAALVVREDIGRHNAVDKAIGWLLNAGRLAEASVLLVSGRVSYEIVYKAYRAGIPFLLAVSAPSSMAVETAERLGMTIVGFCRGDCATVYSKMENVNG